MSEHLDEKLVSFASILEEKTRDQAVASSRMPFIFPHLALMPDAHLGMGATVGSVIPTLGAIMPAAVGVDIGCGMEAVRTQFTAEDLPGDLAPMRAAIEAAVPLSPGRYNRQLTASAKARIRRLEQRAAEDGATAFDPARYAKNWRKQLGSLGGGNHFIEVTLDEQQRVWLFLHSGSRGVGNKIAQHHIKVAREYCEREGIDLPNRDLAYLVEGTEQFTQYVDELRWAQSFARENRAEMMDRLVEVAGDALGAPVQRLQEVSCHHNYTERERHFGKDVWLSRKGAIEASTGTWGLIPGSMGDASYVVRGKGDPMSLNSAPHGAGRVHSRSAAKRNFTLEDLRERMTGIEFRDSAAFIDEIPDAYKSIDVVMADAADLVEIVHTLRQVVNVKGE
ncbi:MAG TPA: RtcB family protein [Ruania sp.]|nr:RtcB family protein [Ruania sp.]